MRRLALAVAVGLLGFSASAADLPKYWTVHIDHPKDRAAYEKLERQFNATIRDFYAANHVDQPASVNFATDDGHHYGLRPRASIWLAHRKTKSTKPR